MSKKFNKFKKEFLQDLSKLTDGTKQEIKHSLGIDETTSSAEHKTPWFKCHFKPIAYSCALALTCLAIIITLVMVTNYNNVPVYQGMFASKIESSKILSGKRLSGEIENELIDEIGVTKLDGISCYEKPNTDIIITINITNPKSYEILSFTLNGNKYQSYQFEKGSDSTQILVKYQTRGESGIEEITIDEIKYIDGKNIKSVRFSGDKTIKIGVTYQNVPTVTKLDDDTNGNTYNLILETKDLDNLIDANRGLYIYLIDNNQVVAKSKLKIGIDNIKFENLNYSTTYSYVVIGVYDLLDGEGMKASVLYSDTFEIEDGYTFGEEAVGTDEFSIKLLKKENFSGKILMAELYYNDMLVSTIKDIQNQISFAGLLSNVEYKVVLTYEFITNNNQTVKKTMSHLVKTKEPQIPTVTFNESPLSIGGTGIIYLSLLIDDKDSVLTSLKVEVYSGDELVQTINLNLKDATDNILDLTISDLTPNSYQLVFVYEYNLNDTNGNILVDRNSNPTTTNKITVEVR